MQAYCAMRNFKAMEVQASPGRRPHRNGLLRALPAPEYRRLIAECESVELACGDVIYEQGRALRYLYFPTGACISLILAVDGDSRFEAGLVGIEGMVGISLLAGVQVVSSRALVQCAGSALRIDAERFTGLLAQNPVLKETLVRYLYVLMIQLGQVAACARFHPVEARVARLLLSARDRAKSDEFQLTQQFLALMLGVRRVGVTQAAVALRGRKLIQYTRGKMQILDGRGLERASCACYAINLRSYRAAMG